MRVLNMKNTMLLLLVLIIAASALLQDLQGAPKPAAKQATGTEKVKKNDTAETKQKKTEPAQSDEKKAEWIDQTLEYGIQEERLTAVAKIQQIKDPAIRGRLVKKLLDIMKNEDDPEVLLKSITILGEMKEMSAVPFIMEKTDHPSEEVQTGAVYALKNMNALSAKGKCIEKLKGRNLENNSNFTVALIQALGEFKSAELVPYVKESLENPKTNAAIKEEMAIFLGKVPSPDSKSVLLKIFKDEEESVTLRSYAVNSLSKIGAKESLGDIKEIIKTIDSYDAKKRKKYYNLYLYTIAALARLGDPEAVPKLINALRSNSAPVRLKAISLIKDFKEKRTIDILKYKMKYDQNSKVQSAARKALQEMGVDVGDDGNNDNKDASKSKKNPGQKR